MNESMKSLVSDAVKKTQSADFKRELGSMKDTNVPVERKCKVCGKETDIVFNIKMKAVPICQSCATAITKQEVATL